MNLIVLPDFLTGSYDLWLLLLFRVGVFFLLYHLFLHSPITDRVWKGTGSLCFHGSYQNKDCVVVMWGGGGGGSSIRTALPIQ